MVPKGWESLTFDDAQISIIDGDRGTEYPKASDFYEDEACLFLSAKNVTSSGFKFDDVQFISYEKHQRLRKGTVNRFDLVLTTRGSVGNFAYYDQDVPYDLIRINSGMVVIRSLESKLDSKFLYTTCTSSLIQKQIERAAFGSAQPQLTVSIIKNLTVPVPPLPEQRKIAQILSTWDKAITTTERLLANKQQQKKALMQRLLTGKQRFAGFEGEWKLLPINEISERIQRKSDQGTHPILTISSLSGFVTQEERYSRFMAGESLNNYILLHKGEFAYNKGNSKTYQFGCVFDLDTFVTGLVPNIYVCFRLKQKMDRLFYKYLFEMDYLKPQLAGLVNTGVRNNGLLNIKPTEFLGTVVPVPSYEEQQVIGKCIHVASTELSAIENKLNNLKQQKKALMQQLLTGKRRVKVDEATA